MAKKAEDFGGMIFKVWYDPQVSQDFREKKVCHCNLYLPKPEENE